MGRLLALRIASPRLFLQAWKSAREAGDAIAPIAADAPQSQVEALLTALRPAQLLEQRGDAVEAFDLADPAPNSDDTALIIATSGTTGAPKYVRLSEAAIHAATAASMATLECREGDAWLTCLPLHHVAGLSTVLRSWAANTEPQMWAGDLPSLGSTDAAYVSLVPTMLRRALAADIDLSHFRAVLVGGAPLSEALREQATAAGINVVDSYGMTETVGGCVYEGVPLPRVTVDLDAGGRISLGGPTVMDGYVGDDAATLEALVDGRLLTSDRGEIVDGRLRVLGRIDDVIVTGGEKVDAGVVQARLIEHPAVADAVVVGVPDEEWGQRVAALILAAVGADPSASELRDFVAEALPRYAAPRQFVWAESLPNTALGKTDRVAVLARLAAAWAQDQTQG